jgi:hypothetical protein
MKVGNYIWREATALDRKQLELWIAADPDHAGTVEPEFFCRNAEGRECYAVEDGQGLVIFYLKLTSLYCGKVLQLDIQFRPHDRFARPKWTADALIDGMEWLKTATAGAGVARMTFTSTRPDLIAFAKRRLGFAERDGTLWYTVRPPGTQTDAENAVLVQQ